MDDTRGTRNAFARAFGRLSLATGQEADAARVAVYFDDLKAFPLPAVLAAGEKLRLASDKFPPLSVWHRAAEIETLQRTTDSPELPMLVDPWCGTCCDTGWAPGDRGVLPCECRSRNPVWRARAREDQLAAARRRHLREL